MWMHCAPAMSRMAPLMNSTSNARNTISSHNFSLNTSVCEKTLPLREPWVLQSGGRNPSPDPDSVFSGRSYHVFSSLECGCPEWRQPPPATTSGPGSRAAGRPGGRATSLSHSDSCWADDRFRELGAPSRAAACRSRQDSPCNVPQCTNPPQMTRDARSLARYTCPCNGQLFRGYNLSTV